MLLTAVMALGGLPRDGERVTLPAPPSGDPFRHSYAPAMLTAEQREPAAF